MSQDEYISHQETLNRALLYSLQSISTDNDFKELLSLYLMYSRERNFYFGSLKPVPDKKELKSSEAPSPLFS